MADFASDVTAAADAFRAAAADLDHLMRQVAWAAQDALEGSARLPETNDPRVSREQLALEFGARTLGPAGLRAALASLEDGRATLQRLVEKVVPAPLPEPVMVPKPVAPATPTKRSWLRRLFGSQ